MTGKFQVVIPMTGNGQRFINAGYSVLKPLIEVDGKPIIEWIATKMFSPDDDILFVCRKDHLDQNPQMKSFLESLCLNAKVLSIDNWEKKGPVVDVLKIAEHLDDLRPIVVSYCDYFMRWDWEAFKKQALALNCDGAVPTYTGFHPHLIPQKNLYASCLIDQNENLLEIKEKYSFSDNKNESRHSPGLYYFKSGALLKHYYQKAVEKDLSYSGEYYSSLPYNLMVEDSLSVWCPANVDFFCQWGTPEDLSDYLFWMNLIKGFKK